MHIYAASFFIKSVVNQPLVLCLNVTKLMSRQPQAYQSEKKTCVIGLGFVLVHQRAEDSLKMKKSASYDCVWYKSREDLDGF